MNKRGFTLVELLSVVIILTLLIAFVLPQITNSVRNYQTKTNEVTTKLILDAAKLYVEDNSNKYPKKVYNSYCITMNELIGNDYLKNKIKLNDMDVTNSKSVQVTYDGEFNYELVDSSFCRYYNPICEPVTEDTVTTGNIPKGNFESGDEYICEVKSGVKHHFFVLNRNNDTISLIMNRNICEDGSVATEENTCLVEWTSKEDGSTGNNDRGPVTAMNLLYKSTRKWTNVPNIIINYSETIDSFGYGGIKTINNVTKIMNKDGDEVTSKYIDLKARMVYYSEISDYDSTNKSNTYLYDYLTMYNNIQINVINGVEGYWSISSKVDTSPPSAYGVDRLGYISSGGVENTLGVRPVIELKRGNFPLCTLISGDENVEGSKYVCEVKQGSNYNFYVISHEEDGTTNLIMDRNINSDGTQVTEGIKKSDSESNNGIYNLTAWITKDDYDDDTNWGEEGNNNKGPITAMNFLYEATKDWINTNKIIINLFEIDEEKHNMTKTYETYARMPYKSEIKDNAYFYNYLESGGIQENIISGVNGYWTLSARSDIAKSAWGVYYYGSIGSLDEYINHGDSLGIRPIINVKL